MVLKSPNSGPLKITLTSAVALVEGVIVDADGRPGVRDIKVDGREAPIRAATGCPLGRGAHACCGVSQRSLTVAALSGSRVYARILAIGGHLGKSPHFYVAHPPHFFALSWNASSDSAPFRGFHASE